MVEVDGRPLSRWAGDGVVCATPTGSTAYAFSAGGPVVWPDLAALLLVPLSAHALFARPLVVSPTSVVAVTLLEGLRGDGHAVVRRAPHLRACRPAHGSRYAAATSPVLLARLHEAPFTDRLVRKFGLPTSGWRGARRPGRVSRPRPMWEEIRLRRLGVIDDGVPHARSRLHRRHRRDRRRQDHGRHRAGAAAGRPRRQRPGARRQRTGAGRGHRRAVRAARCCRGGRGGGRRARGRLGHPGAHAQRRRARPLARPPRWRVGARLGARRARRAAGDGARPVRAAPAAPPGRPARGARPVRRRAGGRPARRLPPRLPPAGRAREPSWPTWSRASRSGPARSTRCGTGWTRSPRSRRSPARTRRCAARRTGWPTPSRCAPPPSRRTPALAGDAEQAVDAPDVTALTAAARGCLRRGARARPGAGGAGRPRGRAVLRRRRPRPRPGGLHRGRRGRPGAAGRRAGAAGRCWPRSRASTARPSTTCWPGRSRRRRGWHALEGADDAIGRLRAEVAELAERLADLAPRLSAARSRLPRRCRTGSPPSSPIWPCRTRGSLVDVRPGGDLGPDGADEVEILLSANPGVAGPLAGPRGQRRRAVAGHARPRGGARRLGGGARRSCSTRSTPASADAPPSRSGAGWPGWPAAPRCSRSPTCRRSRPSPTGTTWSPSPTTAPSRPAASPRSTPRAGTRAVPDAGGLEDSAAAAAHAEELLELAAHDRAGSLTRPPRAEWRASEDARRAGVLQTLFAPLSGPRGGRATQRWGRRRGRSGREAARREAQCGAGEELPWQARGRS